MPKRRHRETATISDRTNRLANELPQILDTITLEIAHAHTQTPPETHTHTSHIPDPTLAAVLSRSQHITAQREILEAIPAITALLNRIETAANPYRNRTQHDTPTCYVAGCTQYVSSYTRNDGTIGHRLNGEHGGMCDTHRARARRESQHQ